MRAIINMNPKSINPVVEGAIYNISFRPHIKAVKDVI